MQGAGKRSTYTKLQDKVSVMEGSRRDVEVERKEGLDQVDVQSSERI